MGLNSGEYPEADHNATEGAYAEAQNVKQVVMRKSHDYPFEGRLLNTEKFQVY